MTLPTVSTHATTPRSNPPTRVRIYSHVTQSRFLHIESALHFGKLRLFAGTYKRGSGMQQHVAHFLDIADARVVFAALANGEPAFSYKEYKGSPPAGGKAAESRTLSVTIKEDNVYIELKSGPGQLTATGAITPAGRATTEVNVGCKRYEAQRLGAAVLAYVQAWDVHRMLQHHAQVQPAPPYEEVSAERRPPTLPQQTERATAPTADRPTTRCDTLTDLRYGDGTPVAADNAVERQTFAHYRRRTGRIPPSKAALQAFYAQENGGTTAEAVTA